MDCRGLLCGMGNTGSMTSADELNEQYDADGSVTQVPERNDEVHAGESAVAQSRESAVTIPAGTVVLAATPIGNVGDASARLVALLERADIVAAEDTRRLYDLARRLGVYVNGRVIAYHDHNEPRSRTICSPLPNVPSKVRTITKSLPAASPLYSICSFPLWCL